jgi:hypothetical protein
LCAAGILVFDMAYGVVRQGLDPGLQVFLCQQHGVHSSCGSDPLLFTRFNARAKPSAASKLVSDCHSVGRHAQVD